MRTVTVSLPDALAERLNREARQQSVTPDVIVRQALEQALADEGNAGERSVFERLQSLMVNDPASPPDLATNLASMKGFGASAEASPHPSGRAGHRVSMLWICILLILGVTPAWGWRRAGVSDPDVVRRADLMVIAHVREGSIKYVPHPSQDGSMSWEYHATLVLTEVIKGICHDQEIPIIIHYGLDPLISTKDKDPHPHSFAERDAAKYLGPTSKIRIYDVGARQGRIISGDIRNDHIWLLRIQSEKTGGYDSDENAGTLGIWDPEDIQSLDLKDYFLTFLSDHPEEKLKGYAVGASPLAIRSRIYLEHLKIEEASREPDLIKRTDLLLPFFLFTEEEGPTQREAEEKMMLTCGQAAAARLVPIFKDPKYAAMQSEIMMVWSNARYFEAVPILIDLLQTENQFWAKQTPAEKDLWVNNGPNYASTMAQKLSKGRITMTLFALGQFGDPRARPIVEETKQFWERFYPNRQGNYVVNDCNQTISAIENAEVQRRRRTGE